MRFLCTLLLVGSLSVGALIPNANATSVIAVDVAEQALDSTAVVYARVGAVDPVLTPTRAYIDTRLEVLDVLAGEAPTALSIRQVGGTHGDRTVFVPGDGRLVPGARVVAFIRKVQGRWYLTAMAQSVWTVEGRGRTALVQRDLEGLSMHERGPNGAVVEPTMSLPEFKTYGELAVAVRDLPMGQP